MSSILFQRCGRLGLARLGRAAPRESKQLSTVVGHSNQVFVLEYTFVPNMIEKRVPVRPAHLEFTKPHIESKKLLAGGALLPGMEGGLLLFRAPEEYVEDFAKNDPYVVEGLVTEYRIREWAIAVGGV
jgi:uncharacterized protein YciI